MIGISRFEDGHFRGGKGEYAVSAQKFTKEQAIEKAKVECELPYAKDYYICIMDGFVRWRTGVDEGGERQIGWWLEYDEHRRSCPVYIFYLVRESELERDKNWGAWEREYIKMRGSFEEGRQKDQQQ